MAAVSATSVAPVRVFAAIAASVAGAAVRPAAFSIHQPSAVPTAGGPAPAAAAGVSVFARPPPVLPHIVLSINLRQRPE
jgi:hypothetical protein